MSCEDTLHINFRQLSQWMGDDVRPWSPFVKESVVNLIWHGADRSGETVFDKVPVEWLIGSPGTLGAGTVFSVAVSEEALKSIKL